MSYYIHYFLGAQTKDGKIFPLGPYDHKGELQCAFWRSRSSYLEPADTFYPVKEDQVTDELRKEFEYENWNGEKILSVRYLPVKELPGIDFIRKGYFLISDIEQYNRAQVESDEYFEGFYDWLSPETYALRMENELKFGSPKTKKDEWGDEYTPHSCSEYAYFTYPEYDSKEYESFVLRTIADVYDRYGLGLDDETKVVILETEG